jgi:hypothetical protein
MARGWLPVRFCSFYRHLRQADAEHEVVAVHGLMPLCGGNQLRVLRRREFDIVPLPQPARRLQAIGIVSTSEGKCLLMRPAISERNCNDPVMLSGSNPNRP